MPETTRARRWLRAAVISLGGMQTAGMTMLGVSVLQSTDPLGRAIAMGLLELTAIPFVLLVVPGLALGLTDRRLALGLGLLVAAIPATLALWRFA